VTTAYLRRYTELPALIYLLRERKLTLLDPQSWDDLNDSHYLELYRQKKKLKSVLALCFTQTVETYHHWRVFAGGSGGVCIRFRRSDLIRATKVQEGLRRGPVKYFTLSELRRRRPEVDALPFLKRFGFQHENEWRMIYESAIQRVSSLTIDIPLSCIQRITLSPWMPSSLVPHVKERLRSIKGCGALEVVHSTLISNDEWKRLGDTATKGA
jgi:hypothetical protein